MSEDSVRITRLDNGLTIATDHIPHVETVALGAFVGVGTRHETATENGVAHLLEHMAFKGSAAAASPAGRSDPSSPPRRR